MTYIALTAALLAAGGSQSAAERQLSQEEAFRNPPNDYRLVQYMGHGSGAIPIEKIQQYGIGGVMLFMASHGYLRNPEAWAAMERNIARASEADLQVWIGDDNAYPSGMAGGLVAAADASYEARGLTQVTLQGHGMTEARLALPPEAERFVHGAIYPLEDGGPNLAAGRAARVTEQSIESAGLEGPWLLCGFAVQVIDEGTQALQTAKQFGTSGRYANLLNPDAMETFVELTYAEYAQRMGPLTGKIDLFYTNEPNLMTLYFERDSRPGGEAFTPWTQGLPERFRAHHGYDLMPRLAALFGGESDGAKLVRRHFYQTAGQMLAENFSERIASWATGHGVGSGGHLLLEEYMSMHVANYGDFLRVLKEQHAPGCDIPMPDAGQPWNYWMPKYVSSAAFLAGRELTTALLDPIIGRPQPILKPAPREFRRIVYMAFLTGVNQISTYIRWQDYETETYRALNEYAGRLAFMLRGTRPATAIAMYYPIETFQASFVPSPRFWSPMAWDYRHLQRPQDEVARILLESRRDFLFLDADAILKAEIRRGELRVRDHGFSTIVMPKVELLPLAVLRRLEEFQEAGGTVLWVDGLPRLGDAPSEHEAVRAAAGGFKSIAPAQVVTLAGRAFPPSFRLAFDGPEAGFHLGRFTRSQDHLYYLVNNTGSPLEVTVSGAPNARLCDPMDGSMRLESLPATVAIEPYVSLFVLDVRTE